MEANSDSHEDELQSCVNSNASPSIDAIIPRSLKAHMTGERTISEEIIAVTGAIPSSILIYMSIHYNLLPRTAVHITYVLAIVIGSTIALHFEAWRLLTRSGKI
jgi:hypothetical protein